MAFSQVGCRSQNGLQVNLRVSFAGFTAEDKAVSQYMNKFLARQGMTVDQLRQAYGDNNVNAVIKKLKG